MPCTY